MVSIVTKRIKGHEYMYLVESVREGKSVRQKTIRYIGKKRPIPKEEFRCMVMSYEDKDWVLDGFADHLSYQDHKGMKDASDNHKRYLKTLDKTSKEKQKHKFLSEFIANSNAIEGSTMTSNETYNFLFEDMTTGGHSKKELHMATNLLGAWNYLEKNYRRFPTMNDIKEMHRMVNKDIESEKTLGKIKPVQNYIGDILTTSFVFAEEKAARLLRWIKAAYSKMDDFEVAFQSHAQFEIIHPFVDGNGRVGRLLLNWLLMHKGLEPLAIRMKRRRSYLSSLDNSRRGKVEVLCRFCFGEYMEQYGFVVVN